MIKSDPEVINFNNKIAKNHWMPVHKCTIIVSNNTPQASHWVRPVYALQPRGFFFLGAE